ncbi:MAG: hypothetical protein IT249_10395 [Chitinophagaceae bacterium]|nr:hypothetical protein [Chitinophagaceae bacterium]
MNNINHIIERQSIAINFEDAGLHIGIQNRIAELFYTRLQPRMESLFNEMADDDHVAIIDKLEIDCGLLPAKHWEDEWVDCTIRKLKEQLTVIPKKKITAADMQADFFYFLQQGQLPWNSRVKSLKIFEQSIVLDHIFLVKLKRVLSKKNVIRRLTEQFSIEFVSKITNALTNSQMQPGFNIINEISLPNVNPSAIQQLETQLMKLAQDNSVHNSDDTKTEDDYSDQETGNLYTEYAGLVILHPFLPVLFEALQLTLQHKWVSEEAQHTAVLITAFIVTGNEVFQEFELVLSKLLCGLNPSDVLLNISNAITVETISACEEMIIAAIQHWAALKNTGIAAFRETFLQRDGKITSVDKGWLLQVEQKGVDVLLNSLPWGIGVVKLPWMKTPIYTEWNS